MVALLFSIVIIFLLCHAARLSLNIYEAFQVENERESEQLFQSGRAFAMTTTKSVRLFLAQIYFVKEGRFECPSLRKDSLLGTPDNLVSPLSKISFI